MIEKDYLPQYAAELVRDLDELVKYLKSFRTRSPFEESALKAYKFYGELVRAATHLVLPPNGEIYREGNYIPTPQECQSIAGLPNLFTTFELPLTDKITKREGVESGDAPDAILILAVDYKQIDAFDNEAYEGNKNQKHRTPMMIMEFSRYKSGHHPAVPNVRWGMASCNATYLTPIEMKSSSPAEKLWSTELAIGNTYTGERIPFEDGSDTAKSALGVYSGCLNIVLQACHALNVGAVLELRKEKSYTRSRTLQKQGVGGFEYHVLRLPHGTVKETLGNRSGGDRDGPRYHFRRAHLRNLSSGAQTFVRSCFVGNRDKGVVEKNYEVTKGEAA